MCCDGGDVSCSLLSVPRVRFTSSRNTPWGNSCWDWGTSLDPWLESPVLGLKFQDHSLQSWHDYFQSYYTWDWFEAAEGVSVNGQFWFASEW